MNESVAVLGIMSMVFIAVMWNVVDWMFPSKEDPVEVTYDFQETVQNVKSPKTEEWEQWIEEEWPNLSPDSQKLIRDMPKLMPDEYEEDEVIEIRIVR